jgi:hypothetical protein
MAIAHEQRVGSAFVTHCSAHTSALRSSHD